MRSQSTGTTGCECAISVGPETCGSLEEGGRREWLETNGLGGFASSSLIGMNTRRYHGLLVAAWRPPTGRLVLLSRLEETVVVDGERFELGANQYPGVVQPEGYRYLISFRLDPYPIWTYQCGATRIEKSVCMIHGENTTVVRYKSVGQDAGDVRLELRPLIAFREYHALTYENSELNEAVEQTEGRITLAPYPELPALHLAHNSESVDNAGFWYRNFEYSRERDRGLDHREDLFSPCALEFVLNGDKAASVIASTEIRQVGQADALLAKEISRRPAVADEGVRCNPVVHRLRFAADQFIVRRGDGKTIIAGYPWFTDWSRDTMISLPGLSLATDRPEIARSLLLNFACYVDDGMLPNRFPDRGEEPEYNTVDGTLWFFAAVDAYARHTGDYATVLNQLYPVMVNIVEWHLRGTRYNIRVDSDGLLHAGEEGVQLTWMDAKVGDWVVTPRQGKPVEIQALWYNALQVLADLARRLDEGENARHYDALCSKARRSFAAKFWNERSQCLYDVVDSDEQDDSIRPNQLIALSLEHIMMPREKALTVLETVDRHLLTPVGIRTLSPQDPHYHPQYSGDIYRRDSAYHQGTVWPWLIGPYFSAVRRFRGSTVASKQIRAWLDGYQPRLTELCLGQAPEVYDGDAPHMPGGCPAQAWSVAEILRVISMTPSI